MANKLPMGVLPNPAKGATSVRSFTSTKRDVKPVVRSISAGKTTNPGWSLGRVGKVTLAKIDERVEAQIAAYAFYDEYNNLVKEAGPIEQALASAKGKITNPGASKVVSVKAVPKAVEKLKVRMPRARMKFVKPPRISTPTLKLPKPGKSVKLAPGAKAPSAKSLRMKSRPPKAKIKSVKSSVKIPKVKRIKKYSAAQKNFVGRPKGEMPQALKNILTIGAGAGTGAGAGYLLRKLMAMGTVKGMGKASPKWRRALKKIVPPVGGLAVGALGGYATHLATRQHKVSDQKIRDAVKRNIQKQRASGAK